MILQDPHITLPFHSYCTYQFALTMSSFFTVYRSTHSVTSCRTVYLYLLSMPLQVYVLYSGVVVVALLSTANMQDTSTGFCSLPGLLMVLNWHLPARMERYSLNTTCYCVTNSVCLCIDPVLVLPVCVPSCPPHILSLCCRCACGTPPQGNRWEPA